MEERTLTILKNEPIYPFNEADYTKPRHIIVEGTYEDIGFDLATLAKKDYGTKLGVYDQPIYAEARRQYLATNWPAMLERSQGVLRAYGLPDNDVVHDPTALPFDWYDAVRGRDLGAHTCSAAVLPIEKSENGATFVSRNFDLMAMVLWSELFGKKPPEGAYNCWERGVVLETRPDNGYKTILVGGQELLTPYIDGINETGLYISLFHDPWGVGDEAGPASGMSMSGVSVVQAVSMLLDTCATVEEAKKTILNNRVMHVIMCSHMIIADATGNATIFEIDKHSQTNVFTDRKANEPLFITNHPVSKFPEPSTYPEFDEDAEHNTFQRQVILRDTYAGLSPPFKKADATVMTDAVHCAFIDDKKAEAGPKERTLINTTADLSKPEISVRWYLGDVGPIAGTNHVEDRMSDYYTFGF
jgi:hypothetical protein